MNNPLLFLLDGLSGGLCRNAYFHVLFSGRTQASCRLSTTGSCLFLAEAELPLLVEVA